MYFEGEESYQPNAAFIPIQAFERSSSLISFSTSSFSLGLFIVTRFAPLVMQSSWAAFQVLACPVTK